MGFGWSSASLPNLWAPKGLPLKANLRRKERNKEIRPEWALCLYETRVRRQDDLNKTNTNKV